MPAPSPAIGSAPTAPRCSRISRMQSASSISLWVLPPLRLAIKPTPQASYSRPGSNWPPASGTKGMAPGLGLPPLWDLSVVIGLTPSGSDWPHHWLGVYAQGPCPFPETGPGQGAAVHAERDAAGPLAVLKLPP